MTERGVEEAFVLGDESSIAAAMQKRKKIRVFDTARCEFVSDLAKVYAPSLQQRAPVLREVLVQKIQAAATADPL